VTIVEDLTAARRNEERLRQTRTMEVVGQLAGGVAHDFNNLLQVILGYTDEALDGIAEHDPRHDSLLQVEVAAKRAAKLTHQLLAFGRKQVLEPEPLDLCAVVSGLEEVIARLVGPAVALELRNGPEPCPVLADRAQLQHAVLNLCLNARDAMPAGGRLTIATETLSADEERCSDHACPYPGRYAVIRVTDTGPGIDAESLDRIFEPFYATSAPGECHGLGLSAAFGIATQHGGTVTATSTPGQGSTFSLVLPCRENGSPLPQPLAGPAAAAGTAKDMPPTRGQPEGSAWPGPDGTGRFSAEEARPTAADTAGAPTSSAPRASPDAERARP
jgi:signal transduction histidine kinase